MSLKMKIPLLVAAMLLFNVIVITVYNRVYFLNKVAEKIEQFSGRPVDPKMLRESTAVWELAMFEIIIIAFMIFIIGVVVYFTYAKPLINLNKVVGDYQNSEIKSTKRKDEIGQLQNGFYKLSQNLYEEKQIQNRMIASISHDIKTPLTSVLGYSENLMKKSLSADRQKHYLNIIHESASDIEYIITEFDSYITGKLREQTVKKPVKVSYLAKMLKGEYETDGCTIIVNNLCDEQDEINIDLPKIRRVFANLIRNAIKHNQDKTEIIIKITLSQIDGKFKFFIEDNGSGVSADILPHIFEPFYSTVTGETISGLGLSICNDIIKNHGGEIFAVNTDNGFMITFSI